jgi:phasin
LLIQPFLFNTANYNRQPNSALGDYSPGAGHSARRQEIAMQNTPNFAELPDSIRTIMKSSIEQARKAFETFVSTSEKMIHGIDTSSNPAADSLKHLNEKIAAFTRQNAESNFALALKLADARQLSDIVEIQNAHVREQMEIFSHQLEELRDLTMKAVKDGSRAASTAMQSVPTTTFGS